MIIDDQHIINFIEGKLSQKASADFEAALSQDAALRDAYHAHMAIKEAMQYAKEEDLKKTFGTWKTELNDKTAKASRPIHIRRIYSIAASVLVLCVASFLIYQKTTKPQRIFATYYSEPIPTISRDASNKELIPRYREAIQLYATGSFSQVIPVFNSWPSDDEHFEEIQLLLIDSYIQTELWDSALKVIDEAPSKQNLTSTTKARLEWLKALILIRQNKPKLAKPLLDKITSQRDHLYFTQAKSLKEGL